MGWEWVGQSVKKAHAKKIKSNYSFTNMGVGDKRPQGKNKYPYSLTMIDQI